VASIDLGGRALPATDAGVRLIISDACMGLTESAAEFFPEAALHRAPVREHELINFEHNWRRLPQCAAPRRA
jgi:hypothetical protein